MKIEEAITILGISYNSNVDEIKKRFKELSLDNHPDRGGDGDYMARLIEARDIAINACSSGNIVPVNAIQEIVVSSLKTIIERRDAKEASKRQVKHVIKMSISPINRIKRWLATIGLISAAISILSNQIFPLLKASFPSMEKLSGTVSFAFGCIAALLAVIYWICDTKIRRLEEIIHIFDEHLSDQYLFLELLQQVIPMSHLSATWTRRELEEFLDSWVKDQRKKDDDRDLYWRNESIYVAIKKIGVYKVASLISSKGKALGIIIENREVTDGWQEITMKLAKPSNI